MSHDYSAASLRSRERVQEHRSWLKLSLLAQQTLDKTWKAIDYYQSARTVWKELALTNKERKNCNAQLAALEEQAQERNERIVTPADSEYPLQLLDLPQPPAALYVAGSQRLNVTNQLAIVGSRFATPYGMSQSATLARLLAEHGIVVTSGLARGIDSQAHRGALKANGHTIAVIGCGLDIFYPRENRKLQSTIMEKGNVVSEYPYGTPPLHWHFPARNRIIAALTIGTIVVQASRHSGALITANIANDIGREVMVVPGALDVCQSGGCLQLLMEGANPVRHVRDIFDVLQVFAACSNDNDPNLQLSERAREVLANLTAEGATIDTLVERSRLEPGLIAAILNQLNLLGSVQRLPDGVWIPI